MLKYFSQNMEKERINMDNRKTTTIIIDNCNNIKYGLYFFKKKKAE